MSSSTNPKYLLFEQFARVAKALGQVHRLEIVEALAQGERGVEALARSTGLSIANTSQHLQQLRQAGLVVSRKEGTHVIYRLSGDDVIGLLGALQHTAERHIAEVDRVVHSYYHDRDAMEPVSRAELMARIHDGTATVIDVRPADEFAAGHLPGAVNIPLKDLETRLSSLPPGREVIAYCRGNWCVLSFEAVARLRERGISARRLAEGFPEWKVEGLPVERIPG